MLAPASAGVTAAASLGLPEHKPDHRERQCRKRQTEQQAGAQFAASLRPMPPWLSDWPRTATASLCVDRVGQVQRPSMKKATSGLLASAVSKRVTVKVSADAT